MIAVGNLPAVSLRHHRRYFVEDAGPAESAGRPVKFAADANIQPSPVDTILAWHPRLQRWEGPQANRNEKRLQLAQSTVPSNRARGDTDCRKLKVSLSGRSISASAGVSDTRSPTSCRVGIEAEAKYLARDRSTTGSQDEEVRVRTN